MIRTRVISCNDRKGRPLRPRIVQHYRNYTPPMDLTPAVELLLRYVSDQQLAGLDYIELTNSTSTRKLRRKKTWSGRKKVKLSECLGLYHGNHIQLFVDHILEGPPKRMIRLPFTRTGLVGMVLYHEIGHHIHRTLHPAYSDPEKEADKWMKVLLKNFLAKHYWYLMPIRKPLAHFLRMVMVSSGRT